MTRAIQVLVIEDDEAVRQGLLDALSAHGFFAEGCPDARSGLDAALLGAFDLVLLDLNLPDADGLEVLREIREVRPTLPVLCLTARGTEEDRVAGLLGGADDYVVKPFSVRELVARIRAVLRRTAERPADVDRIDVRGRTVDFRRREVVHADGERCELSEKEAELLRYLASHRGRAVSREEILRNVWRLDPQGVETRTIDMHVVRLREKLRDDPRRPEVLLTVRGRGYKFGG